MRPNGFYCGENAPSVHTHIFYFYHFRRKHKMKKYIALALATLMAVLCLASCGKDANEPTDNATPDTTVAEETTVA